MNKQIHQLLKDKDYRGALEALKLDNVNAGLVLADYLNEKKLREQQYTSDESWQVYINELVVRIKQLSLEQNGERENIADAKPKEFTDASRQTKPKVFISYSNLDTPITNKVIEYLQKHHFNFFVDSISMVPGDVIETTITKEILTRDYFVILLSRNSLRSPWVCMESVISNMKNVVGTGAVVPIRIDQSLDDFDFLRETQEYIGNKINELDSHIKKIKEPWVSHKYLDVEKNRYIEFARNFDSMITDYRSKACITIYGEGFEEGMKKLLATIQEFRVVLKK